MRRSKVRIVNPLPGSDGITSINRARRFVKHGIAEFTNAEETEIAFLQTPKHVELVQTSEERLHARVVGGNIDNLKGTFFEHARGLPMINPHLMMRGKPAKKREGE
jgi:hypothetical protein